MLSGEEVLHKFKKLCLICFVIIIVKEIILKII